MADNPALIDRDQRDHAVPIRAQAVDQLGLGRLAEGRRHHRVDRGDIVRLFVADERDQAARFLKLIFGPSRGSSHSSAFFWPGGSDFWKAGRCQIRS